MAVVYVLSSDESTLFYVWTAVSGSTGQHLDLDLMSTEKLTIKFGTHWDIAIDNITFTATPVPEPSRCFAGAGALGCLLFTLSRCIRSSARTKSAK